MSASCPPHHVSTAVIEDPAGAAAPEIESRFREVPSSSSQIVHLNVGGAHFTTSRQTLVNSTAVGQASAAAADTFFTALLSGRIASEKDEHGALFIDRLAASIFLQFLGFARPGEINSILLQGSRTLQSDTQLPPDAVPRHLRRGREAAAARGRVLRHLRPRQAGWQFNCTNFRSSFRLKNHLSFLLSFCLIVLPKQYLFSTANPILIQLAKISA